MWIRIALLLTTVVAVRRRSGQPFEANEDVLHNDPGFDELEEISEHPLGAKILQTVALQVKSGEGIDSINSLLINLKSDLEVSTPSIRENKSNKTGPTLRFSHSAKPTWTVIRSASNWRLARSTKWSSRSGGSRATSAITLASLI